MADERMSNDYDELRRALQAGPDSIATDVLGDRYFQDEYSLATLTQEQDAYIAAANPATIARLLAELDETREQRDKGRALLQRWLKYAEARYPALSKEPRNER